VHQAAHIIAHDDLGAGLLVVPDPVPADETRDRPLKDRESAAEPAALVGTARGDDLDPAQRLEEPPHLARPPRQDLLARDAETEAAQAVAALVEADLVGKRPVDRFDLQDIDQKLAELEGMGYQMLKVFFLFLALEEELKILPDHACAAPRRTDDPVEVLENSEQLAGQLGRVLEAAGIELGLAAAGLVFGEFERNPEFLEQPDGRHPHPGIDLVDVAGDKKPHSAEGQSISAP